MLRNFGRRWRKTLRCCALHGPGYDEALAAEHVLEVPVQINGKLRAVVSVPAGSDEELLRATAQKDPKIQAALTGKEIVKVVLLPGKLVNFVVR